MDYINDLSTVSTSEESGATKPLPVTFNLQIKKLNCPAFISDV